MNITILKQEPGQAIPRPFKRAEGIGEMYEIVRNAVCREWDADEALNYGVFNSDDPIFNGKEFKLYAFEEK